MRPGWLKLGWLAPLGYLLLIIGGGITAPKTLDPATRARVPMVLAVMHLCWGAGFLVGRRPHPR